MKIKKQDLIRVFIIMKRVIQFWKLLPKEAIRNLVQKKLKNLKINVVVDMG